MIFTNEININNWESKDCANITSSWQDDGELWQPHQQRLQGNGLLGRALAPAWNNTVGSLGALDTLALSWKSGFPDSVGEKIKPEIDPDLSRTGSLWCDGRDCGGSDICYDCLCRWEPRSWCLQGCPGLKKLDESHIWLLGSPPPALTIPRSHGCISTSRKVLLGLSAECLEPELQPVTSRLSLDCCTKGSSVFSRTAGWRNSLLSKSA